MLIPTRRYTVSDLASFPEDGQKYELLRGQLLVSPAPSVVHQIIVRRLSTRLARYLEPLGLADTLFNVAADISWTDDTLVQPDLLVVRPEELTRRWSSLQNLRLAVEVISPDSGRRDRGEKRLLYQENRVETYWVVDPDRARIEVWRPRDEHPVIHTDRVQWRVGPEAPGFDLAIGPLFRNLPPD